MNTALANNKGELVIPVIVTGTFTHPMFAPDVQKIAQMKMQHLLPSTSNPGALTSGLLGTLLGGQGGAQGQKGGLGGVLGALGGQQQQGQQQPNAQQGQQQQQQQQPAQAIGNILNQVMGNRNKQQQQQQPPPK
jgi:hypothetical protein